MAANSATERPMTDALFWHRVQFGFTITYHYLFPQLTMGLALLLPSAIDPRFSLDARGSATGHHGLAVGLVWWTCAIVLVIAYFSYLFRSLRGKVAAQEAKEGY
jgi:cytochrome bd-type quinol oxidase subunit 2